MAECICGSSLQVIKCTSAWLEHRQFHSAATRRTLTINRSIVTMTSRVNGLTVTEPIGGAQRCRDYRVQLDALGRRGCGRIGQTVLGVVDYQRGTI
jgi:hypothetical protein